MTSCNRRCGACRNSRHYVRATTDRPMLPIILRGVGATAVALGLSGALWFCLTTTLDQMTEADCRAGVQLACEALKR